MAKAYVRTTVVKEMVREVSKEMRIGEDAIDKLDVCIETLIRAAVARALADKRKTIKERDFA